MLATRPPPPGAEEEPPRPPPASAWPWWLSLLLLPLNATGLAHLLRDDWELAAAAAMTFNMVGLGAAADFAPYLAPALAAAGLGWWREAYLLAACTWAPAALRLSASHEVVAAGATLWLAGRLPHWAAPLVFAAAVLLDGRPSPFFPGERDQALLLLFAASAAYAAEQRLWRKRWPAAWQAAAVAAVAAVLAGGGRPPEAERAARVALGTLFALRRRKLWPSFWALAVAAVKYPPRPGLLVFLASQEFAPAPRAWAARPFVLLCALTHFYHHPPQACPPKLTPLLPWCTKPP